MSVNRVTPDNISRVLGYHLRKPDEKDRVFPKNKRVEVVFLVEAVNFILPRTEGVEDITLIRIPGTEYEVPVILPEKLQAVARRRMLAQLIAFRDTKPEELGKHLRRLVNMYRYQKQAGRGSKKKIIHVCVSFVKAKTAVSDPSNWLCYIQPPGGDTQKATDVGMDGFCPACALFGAVITDVNLEFVPKEGGKNEFDESVGIKSRVEFDPAIAFMDKKTTVARYTHNKVADGVSWTGRSLYSENHVLPGTIFVGKVTLEDVTEAELKTFLAVLSGISRLGGRERIYGGVRVHLAGMRGSSYETISALEIARRLAIDYNNDENDTTMPPVEEVLEKVRTFIADKGFREIHSDDFKKLLDDMELWSALWNDTVEYDRQVVARILDIIKGRGKYDQGCESG